MTLIWLQFLTTVWLTLPWTAQCGSARNNNSNSGVNTPDRADGSTADPSSQPLRTLKKLQAMLDETDYVTESPVSNHSSTAHALNSSSRQDVVDDEPSLWTSKDRSKYKRQQQLQNMKRSFDSAVGVDPENELDSTGGSDDASEDGLEYTLPSLPVYLSDGEVSTEDEDGTEDVQRHGEDRSSVVKETDSPQTSITEDTRAAPTPTPTATAHPEHTSPRNISPPPPPIHTVTTTSPVAPYPWNYPYPPPFSVPPNAFPPPYTNSYPYYGYSYPPNPYMIHSPNPTQVYSPPPSYPVETHMQPIPANPWYRPNPMIRQAPQLTITQSPFQSKLTDLNLEAQLNPPTQEEATSPTNISPLPSSIPITTTISLDSVQKILILLTTIVLLCYCAVSPRTLDTFSYNTQVQNNIQRVALAWIPPMAVIIMGIMDRSQMNINSLIHSFYTSFTMGYMASFLLEMIATTILRLSVFALWEPSIFSLTPHVPLLILPWTVREQKYRPKRITLFVADVVTSCIAAPIIEEGIKLAVLISCVQLPKNFQWTRTTSSNHGKKNKKKFIYEPLLDNVTNINTYISHMLMVSLGLKLCDSTRRILMYTKQSDKHKAFYAFCRGLFPIHELCGVMTALQLAKRNVLGVNMPLWKILMPALFVHGMANFRGMKPLFKWKSSTPWSELQLTSFQYSSSWMKMITLNFPRIMWVIILFRVLGYCIKNYYMIGRQAMKRTTTYAGKHSAFSAQLAATEMLKRN